MPNRAANPAHLARVFLLGTFVLMAALMTSLFAGHYRHLNARVDFIGCTVLTGFLFVIGSSLVGWSWCAIRHGISQARWKNTETDPVRRALWSRPVSLVMFGILGAGFISLLEHSFTKARTEVGSDIFVSCLLIFTLITNLKASFAKSSDTAIRLDIQSIAPVQSEHGGSSSEIGKTS